LKVHHTYLTVLIAPLVGVLLYLWSIGQFETMADAPTSSLLGFVFLCWIIAMVITLIVGFPLGFGFSAILRRFHRESLLAYLIGAILLSGMLTLLLGDELMSIGFAATAVLLAFGYWFGVARPRIEAEVD
jgi:hypothetical protein